MRVAFDVKDSSHILKELDDALLLQKPPSMLMPEPRVIFASVLQGEVTFTVTKEWMDRVVKVFDPFDLHGCKKTERTQDVINYARAVIIIPVAGVVWPGNSTGKCHEILPPPVRQYLALGAGYG
jgi:hypothetical protein